MATVVPRRLLLVEDTRTDAFLLCHALSNLQIDVQVVDDGEKALNYIERVTAEMFPHLIVMDLNIPRHDGIEVLKRCRATAALVEVSIVMLTSSDSSRDRTRAERLGVTGFLIKPMDLDEYMGLGTILGRYLNAGPPTDALRSASAE